MRPLLDWQERYLREREAIQDNRSPVAQQAQQRIRQQRERDASLSRDVKRACEEREIFLKFAQTAPPHIERVSIESCPPPEPDILCVCDSRPCYFELATISTSVAA